MILHSGEIPVKPLGFRENNSSIGALKTQHEFRNSANHRPTLIIGLWCKYGPTVE